MSDPANQDDLREALVAIYGALVALRGLIPPSNTGAAAQSSAQFQTYLVQLERVVRRSLDMPPDRDG